MRTSAPEPLVLHTRDGVTLAGARWCTDRPDAAVVFNPGFLMPAQGRSMASLADILVARGVDLVVFEPRGHGASSGESTIGQLEPNDVAAAVAAAAERASRVALVGMSMGAISALGYVCGLALDGAAPLAGLVLVSAPSRWRLPRNPKGLLAAFGTRTPIGRAGVRALFGVRVARHLGLPPPPVELIGTLTVPVAVVHGLRDRFIAHRDGRALHDAAPEPRRLMLVPGMGHGLNPPAVAAIADAVAWVLEHG